MSRTWALVPPLERLKRIINIQLGRAYIDDENGEIVFLVDVSRSLSCDLSRLYYNIWSPESHQPTLSKRTLLSRKNMPNTFCCCCCLPLLFLVVSPLCFRADFHLILNILFRFQAFGAAHGHLSRLQDQRDGDGLQQTRGHGIGRWYSLGGCRCFADCCHRDDSCHRFVLSRGSTVSDFHHYAVALHSIAIPLVMSQGMCLMQIKMCN